MKYSRPHDEPGDRLDDIDGGKAQFEEAKAIDAEEWFKSIGPPAAICNAQAAIARAPFLALALVALVAGALLAVVAWPVGAAWDRRRQ